MTSARPSPPPKGAPGAPAPFVVGLSMVKNEEDVIEPFVRHNLQFLDLLYVADNGSTDRTRDILVALEREGLPLVVFDDPVVSYRQSEKMTRFLRGISAASFPDFLVPLDADEFLRCASREWFNEQLARIPKGGVGYAPWVTYVVTPDDPGRDAGDPPRSITHRRREERPAWDKAILRLDGRFAPSLVITQGNHDVRRRHGGALASVRLEGVSLAHFPVRSAEQLTTKAVVGWMAYLARDRDARQSPDGFQWREAFDLVLARGGIPPEELPERSMLYAQDPRAIDWSRDAVEDPVPFTYVRRHAGGGPGRVLATVARSWEQTLAPADTFAADLERLLSQRQAAPRDADPTQRKVGDTAFDASWHVRHPFVDVAPYRYLSERYRPASVLDVGCGLGANLLLLRSAGATTVIGIDGFPAGETLLPEGSYLMRDVSRPFDVGGPYDLVICTEVVEHLHPADGDALLANLARHAKDLILFSAADVGQPGEKHINCQPAGHWLERWRDLGWEADLFASLAFRSLATLSWLRRNPLVLRRAVAASPGGPALPRDLAQIGEKSYRWHAQEPRTYAHAFAEDPPEDLYPDASEARGLFQQSGQTLLLVDGRAVDANVLGPVNELAWRRGDGALTAVASGVDPYFHLPEFPAPGDGDLVARLLIESTVDSELQLYFQTAEKHSYSEENSASARLARGRSEIFIPLPGRGLRGRIRVDPARAPGVFTIESIECRAVPAGSAVGGAATSAAGIPPHPVEAAAHWCRVVMDAETRRLVESLPHPRLSVLEVSGEKWRGFGFRSYTALSYPQFDLCERALDERFDLIIAEQVFEHLLRPGRAAANVFTMLRPGGHFLVTTPFLLKVHPDPQDCSRWTETGIRLLLAQAGFPPGGITSGSWGNRECLIANLDEWAPYDPRRHSLRNDPELPVVVWALARK